MTKKTKKKTGFRRVLGLLLLLLLVLGFSAMTFSANPLDSEMAQIKGAASQAVDSLRNRDFESAASAFADLDAIVEKYHFLLTASPLAAAKWVPGYGEDVETVVQYMELWKDAYPKLLVPALEKVQDIGLPNMEALGEDPSALSRQLREYADLYETLYPNLLSAADRFNAIPDFHMAQISDRIGPYQTLMKDLSQLLPALKNLPDDVIRPAADLLEQNPLSALRAEEGINIKPVLQYLAFYDQVRPYTNELTNTLARVDMSGFSPEKHAKMMGTVATVRSLLERADAYISVAQSIIGDGQDQVFLIVAQNSAELRAGGGFPGVVCAAAVKNGFASLGEFSSSWELLTGEYIHVRPDQNEADMFGPWFAAGLKDATINPHFPMVASAWADGYEYRFQTRVSGIVSVTPHIVQELLAVCGPITLSNGTELTYDNCMQYLQHDIYYQYLARDTADLSTIVDGLASDQIVDALFEETAKTVMEKMLYKLEGHLTLHDVSLLVDIVEKSFANRTVMVWMADEEIEQQLKALGWSGSLNFEPQKPEIGVYFSVQDANKVGYFVDIETFCDDAGAVRNEDGSVTWPVKVRLHNTLTEEDLEAGSGNWYKLLGSFDGDIASIVHFFAPAGGRIENITYAIPVQGLKGYQVVFFGLTEGEYQDLQVYYNNDFRLRPGEVIEFTYTVTTAPGVSVKPSFSTTPVCSLKY